MELKRKIMFIAIASYIVQVGALWGLLEGYTYFTDDSLKNILREYWILLYIIPVVTTVAYIKDFKEPGPAGGPGGVAEAIGDGEARGGKGGNSGSFGPGGKGGSARAIGSGKAKGGEGGNG